MADDIFVERRDAIATVILNRPERRNAIDFRGWGTLHRIAGELGADPTVRVVILRGAGDQAFSAGADITEFDEHRADSTSARTYAAAVEQALDVVEAIPKPTISLIEGVCVGGGCELSMATDLRIAATGSRFGIPAARLGILVGYKEMRRLVQLVGRGNAAAILLTGRIADAEEALGIGLIDALVDAKRIEEHVMRMAAEIAALAPLSHAGHKRMMRTVLGNSGLEDLTPDDEALPYTVFDTKDFQEGRRAFLEKREPTFSGQ